LLNDKSVRVGAHTSRAPLFFFLVNRNIYGVS
jgi:hypothetical protein